MKLSFPSIEKLKLEGVKMSDPTEADVEWAKKAKKRLKTVDRYLSAVKNQYLLGDKRRCAWLLQARTSDFGLRYKTLSETGLAGKVLNHLLDDPYPIGEPQTEILVYLELRETGSVYRTVKKAVLSDQKGCLEMLKTNHEEILEAIARDDEKVLSGLLEKRYTVLNGKTVPVAKIDNEQMEKELKRMYYTAARKGSVKILDILHAKAPFKSCHDKVFQVTLTQGHYNATGWFVAKGVGRAIVREECKRRDVSYDLVVQASMNNDKNLLMDAKEHMNKVFAKKEDAKSTPSIVPKLNIEWKPVDTDTLARYHRTTKFRHSMLFLFKEQLVIQSVGDKVEDQKRDLDICSFKDFYNPALLKEAETQLKSQRTQTSDPMVKWEMEDSATLIRDHKIDTPWIYLSTVFFFSEKQVYQAVYSSFDNQQLASQTCSFGDFANQELLQEAKDEFKKRDGDLAFLEDQKLPVKRLGASDPVLRRAGSATAPKK